MEEWGLTLWESWAGRISNKRPSAQSLFSGIPTTSVEKWNSFNHELCSEKSIVHEQRNTAKVLPFHSQSLCAFRTPEIQFHQQSIHAPSPPRLKTPFLDPTPLPRLSLLSLQLNRHPPQTIHHRPQITIDFLPRAIEFECCTLLVVSFSFSFPFFIAGTERLMMGVDVEKPGEERD